MNPLDLEAIRGLHRNVGPDHQTFFNGSTEEASRSGHGRDTYCQYSTHSAAEPPLNLAAEGLSHPNFYSNESEDPEDPEGEPFEEDEEEEEEDPELKRKRKELQEIEEQIIRKKVAIALKKVEPFVKEATSPDFSCEEQSVTSGSASLKKRVNAILQQKHSASFLSNLQCRTDRMNSSGPCKGGLVQEDHPLKLRVKALMKPRCNDPCLLSPHREVPDVSPPPPSRRATSPANEGSSQGFQLFLSVLNKGVDMDLLSRIVNDDSEDLPRGAELSNNQPPAAENKSDLPVRSRRSNSGSSLLGHSGTDSRERKTDPPSQERSLSDRLSQHEDNEEEKKNGRRDLHLASSSRSRSPPPVRKKKEIKKPKVDEQQAQLQNVLSSLGLSLEVEEMSKLADRTQERLYGKKHDGASADSRAARERGSHRQHRSASSSSTSSSSSSSGSASRSISPSPSRHHHHHPTRRKSERGVLNNNSGGEPTCGDDNQDDEAAQTVLDGENSTESGVYQQPYPPDQMYPDPHAAALSAFPDYSLSQYAQYDTYHGGSYDVASHSSWTYTQDNVPSSLYPSGYPYPQNTYHHFPGSVSAPNRVYPHQKPYVDFNLLINPDLSKSEGQTGSTSGPRCLQVISTKPAAPQSCLKQITKCGIKRKGNPDTWRRRQRLHRKLKKEEKRKAKEVLKANQKNGPVPTAVQSDEKQPQTDKKQPQTEEKQPQTEEQIKANLRKKLEAFNQKAKQKAEIPRHLSNLSHMSQFADCHESLV